MASCLGYQHVWGVRGDVSGGVCCAGGDSSRARDSLEGGGAAEGSDGIGAAVVKERGEMERDLVVYCAGSCVVVYNANTAKQRFIHGDDDARGFTAMALSPDSKLLALVERGAPGSAPIIAVYDMYTLRKRKILRMEAETFGTDDIGCISFSYNSQLLCVLTKGADCSVGVWDWAKSKDQGKVVLGEGFVRCSFSPLDSSLLCVQGNHSVCFLRLYDTELRLMPSRPAIPNVGRGKDAILSMCWLMSPVDHVVVGTQGGAMHLLAGGEYVCRLEIGSSVTKEAVGDDAESQISGEGDFAVTCLLACSSGFIAGCNLGRVRVFSLNAGATAAAPSPARSSPPVPQNCMFSLHETYQAANSNVGAFVELSLTSDETSLRGITDENQLLHMNMENSVQSGGDQGQAREIVPLVHSFHSGAIVDMDTCIRKPIFATCGVDRTMRIWNFENLSLVMSKEFSDQPHCISLHPSGLHAAIGFMDKVRVVNLLYNDVGTLFEIPIKGCREVSFSRGGQYIALACGSALSVYHFISHERVSELRGHNSKIRRLVWTRDDGSLLSCGQDGAIYQWNVKDGKRIGESVQKGTFYTGLVCTDSRILAVGANCTIKAIDLPEFQLAKEVSTMGVPLGHIALSSSEQLLIAGTVDAGQAGAIRAYQLPLNTQFTEYRCMSTPVACIAISHSGRHLLVADEAGHIFVLDIRDWQDGSGGGGDSRLDRMAGMALPASEEVLITHSDMKEKAALETELKEKVDELILHNEYQLRLKDMSHADKVKEITERFEQELEQSQSKYELLLEDKAFREVEWREREERTNLEHKGKIKERDSAYQDRIMEEMARFQSLAAQRKLEEDKWHEQRETLLAMHRNFIAELRGDFERKLDEEKSAVGQLEREISDMQRGFEESKNQLEDDIDMEVEALRARFESQLQSEREATLKYKGDNGIMKKKFGVLMKEIADERDQVRTLDEKENDLMLKHKSLEREITVHKRDIKSCDECIAAKEKRIYDLKKKNQELEKFKFVLDFKIKELKKQIEPRENEISRMKDQIKEMDAELEKFHNTNAGLDDVIGDLRAKLDKFQRDISSLRCQMTNYENRTFRVKKDLHECAQLVQEPGRLRTAVKALYQAHVSTEVQESTLDEHVQNEYLRHKEFLENNLEMLKEQLEVSVLKHHDYNMKATRENMVLVKEIGVLREGNKATKRVLQANTSILKSLSLALEEPANTSTITSATTTASSTGPEPAADIASLYSTIRVNRKRIEELEGVMRNATNGRYEAAEKAAALAQSYSKEVLPPIDGVSLGASGGGSGRS